MIDKWHIPVTYYPGTECRIFHNGDEWFYEATWMPLGITHIIDVTQGGLEMMCNEKEEGQTPPHGQAYDNARRFYRDVVEGELRDGVGVGVIR